MLHRIRTFATSMLLAAALAAPGCGGRSEGEDTPVRIEFWTLALRPWFTDYIEGLVAAFEADHPGVDVVWVDVPFDAIDRKLIAAAASGRAPDVVNLSDKQFARFVSMGAMVDLTGRLPDDPSATYLEAALRPARMAGGLLGLPWYVTAPVAVVNTSLAEEGGAADLAGRSWEQLRAMARPFHERTGRFLFTVPLGEESELPMMLFADGLHPIRATDGELHADLTDPRIVDQIESWVALYRDGGLPRQAATTGHAHLVELYQRGQVALVNTGPNFLRRIADAAPDIYADTAVGPATTGALGRAGIAVMYLGVTNQSNHPDLAAELAWFITDARNQLAFCRIVPILPSTKQSLADELFRTNGAPGDDAASRIAHARSLSAAALPTAVAYTPALGCWPDMRQAFGEGMKRALLDGADVRRTLREIEREWNRLLAASPPVADPHAVADVAGAHDPEVGG